MVIAQKGPKQDVTVTPSQFSNIFDGTRAAGLMALDAYAWGVIGDQALSIVLRAIDLSSRRITAAQEEAEGAGMGNQQIRIQISTGGRNVNGIVEGEMFTPFPTGPIRDVESARNSVLYIAELLIRHELQLHRLDRDRDTDAWRPVSRNPEDILSARATVMALRGVQAFDVGSFRRDWGDAMRRLRRESQ